MTNSLAELVMIALDRGQTWAEQGLRMIVGGGRVAAFDPLRSVAASPIRGYSVTYMPGHLKALLRPLLVIVDRIAPSQGAPLHLVRRSA